MSTKEMPLVTPAPQRPPRRLVRAAFVFYGALFAVAWLWRAAARGEPLAADGGQTIDWVREPILGLAAAALVIALSEVLTRWTASGRALARALGTLLGPIRRRDCVVLAALSGLGEEALFRGALQPEVGLWLASLLFAAAHLVPRRDLFLWSVFSLAAGLLFGALRDATGSLVAPVVAHFGVNAVNLARLARSAESDHFDLDARAGG